MFHVLMRDARRKEEARKVIQQGKASQHTQKENELPRVGQYMYMYMYMYMYV